MPRLQLLLSLFLIILSCAGESRKFSRCEEACEYRRRDCIESCGGYNSLNLSFSIGENTSFNPFSCTERCEAVNKACLDRCREGER